MTVVSALSPDELKDAISWLQMFKEPYSRVEELWKRTSMLDSSFIHSDNNPPSLNKVLENWPRYSDTKGYLLVSVLCCFDLHLCASRTSVVFTCDCCLDPVITSV